MELVFFLNIFCGLYTVMYTLFLMNTFYQYTQLTRWQQELATININAGPFIAFLASVSWLISRVFN